MGKKRIAVMMCAISFDNQKKILEGIISYAKEADTKVFVFTNHINYEENELNKRGAFQVMELPDFRRFDGVILAKNTIHYEPAAKQLLEHIKESGVPAVNIDEEADQIPNVRVSDYQAQKMLVRHLIEQHGKRDIAYVSGYLTNQEGRERYGGYRDALEEAGITCGADRVCSGKYDMESGRRAVRHLQESKAGMPEAIVCANDSMAVGVIAQLKEFGYQVPQDVAVTGFDGDRIGEYHAPPITTADRSQHLLGYRAAQLLLRGEKAGGNDCIIMNPKIRIRNSCGCKTRMAGSKADLRKKFAEKVAVMQQASDSIKNMISEFAGLEEEGELVEALKKYVISSDMKSFYLCLCEKESNLDYTAEIHGNYKVKEANTKYTDRMRVALAYREETFFLHEPIDREELIPGGGNSSDSCRMYIVTPVYYHNCCYGYCVSGDSYFPLKSELFYSWVLNIGIGLENIRKLTLLNETVNKLNGMWVYDMLTHVYNRAGFFHYSARLLKKLKAGKEMVCIVFADIDGLKKVNDNFGHKKGDAVIREVAEALRINLREDQLLMRYGGDEFVIFGKAESQAAVEKQIADVREVFRQINESGQYSYSIEASMGFFVYGAEEITQLSDLIEQADCKMYEEKKKRNSRDKSLPV